ncbi:MAG: restriction endonuclease subunit S [Akkermansia sp.]|nr:restriction endonuclease subunit S [Akkermansia sp.]
MKTLTDTLANLCEGIYDCPHTTAVDEGSGYPLIRTPNVGRGRLILEGVHRVSEEVYIQRNKRATPKEGDLIFAREAPAGNVALIEKNQHVCLGQRTVLIRPDRTKVDPSFLTYFLLSAPVQYDLLGMANGATVAHVNLPVIRGLKVTIPSSLEEQRKVAHVLSAYDTLIENNRKQIKLLEEAARRLYKEWFVDLRFPGHEHTPIVNGIPEGWTMLQTADVITFDPSVKLEKGQTRENVPMTALSTSGCTLDKSLITRTTSCSGSRFQNGDTLLARISPSLENGKTAYVQGLEGPAVGSTEYIVMRGKSIPSIMVYLYARTENFRKVAIGSMKGSDGRQRAQKDMLTSLPYIKAPDTLLKDFEGIAQPMFTLIEQLCTYNQHLTEARDRLLPKLMSGEIAIK